MFAQYLDAVMRHAHYELIEGGTYFGAIDELPGSWANAPKLDGCVQEMRSVAEGWILLAIADHAALPAIDGHKLVGEARS
jgi:predicted RNase H-like HicB family nuclease